MSRTPRIIYATFATTRRSGGVYVMSEHVRLLRSVGRDAYLWLPGPDAAPAWFDAAVPTLIGPTLELGADDLLVLPEVPVVPGVDPAPGARAVIFNQNHFYTYAAGPASDWKSYPDWRRAPAMWTVSEESREVLGALHPDLDVVVIPNPVAADLFQPRPSSPPSIAWFSRKRPREAALLHRLLLKDVRLDGVALHDITDEPWPEVAQILGAATVMVALGHTEGFGLPLAEALAAGCLIAGYDGGGGRELFDAPGAWPVPEQRPLLLAEQVADLVSRRSELKSLGAANRSWVMARYGIANTLAALVPAVDVALGRPGSAATATHPARWLDQVPPGFHLTG
jgi:glycosyltransferase involved in cell wall biosynthesis